MITLGRLQQDVCVHRPHEYHSQSVRPSPSSQIAVISCHDNPLTFLSFFYILQKQQEDLVMMLATT
jgi:hypothetical protein